MLAEHFEYISGIDLSPNYQSIASLNYNLTNIQWIHANIEFTYLDSEFYIVVICFAFHEMIPSAIDNTLNEAYRKKKREK